MSRRGISRFKKEERMTAKGKKTVEGNKEKKREQFSFIISSGSRER